MAGNNIRKRSFSLECENAKRQQLSRNDSESSSEDECDFGQKPPSLVDYIKGTLNNYPDGSQILKEIIQNADDAGATRIEFLLDYSTHSCDKIIHPVCSQYQGQALYSWNNAKFQTADWKGIQSVGVSGKAKESLKVGRFGLGFVAVYHITDVPIVLSDKSIGLLDPQEQIFHRQPGRKFKLSRFFRDDKYSDHQSCFRSYFGYSGAGEYNGTIFRFPLRTEQCNSIIKPDGVYSAEKVKTTLFEALELEADNVLIFLKRVKSIKLFTRDPLGIQSSYNFLVKIPDSYLTGVQGSNTLLSDHVLNKQFHKSIKVTVNIFPISSTSGDKVWLVLNLIGFPQSPPTLSQFYSDKKLDYLPWVGIAMETGIREDQLTTSQTFNFTHNWDGSELMSLIESILSEIMLHFIVPFDHKLTLNSGNLFCFLPTPEPSYLPFNLHGYFALSNDRRRIKWPSRDSDDTDSKWNELLLGQLGVSAFAIFYRVLVHCFHHENPEVYHYRLLGGETTDSHPMPSILVNQGLRKIVNDRIVYSHIINDWIRVDDALFHPIQYSINEYDCTQVKLAIQTLLEFLQEPLVLLPNHVLSLFNKIDALKSTMDKNRITPDILRKILKNRSNEELIDYFEKNIATHTFVVLSFILSDLDNSCDHIPNVLDNIPLLLSASSKSFKFSINSTTPLYIYEKEMDLLSMFPGTEHLFVHQQIPTKSYNCLLTISQRFFGKINIRDISKLRSDSILLNQLFKLSLESYFKQLTPPVHWNPNRSPFDRDWLKRVWYFIGSDSTLASSLGALPLLPKEDICSENNQLLSVKPTVSSAEYVLYSFDARYSPMEDMLVDSGAVFINPHRFIDCLESLVVRQLPNGLLILLEKNSSILNFFIRQLNYCSNQELFKNVIDVLIINHPFSVNQIKIIMKLPIFPNMIGSHISLTEYYIRVPDNIILPGNIQYPSEFLSPDSPSMSILFNKLNVPSLDIDSFVREHIMPFIETLCKKPDLLKNHFQLSQWLLNLIDRLSPELVKFLKLKSAWVADNSNSPILDSSSFHKPSQLFDPDDEILKDLLLTNSSLFPHSEFEAYFHITKRKQFFITSTTLIDQNLFEEVFISAINNFPIILTAPNCEHVWKFRFSNLLTFINSCWTTNNLKIDKISNIFESIKIVLPLYIRPDSFPVCIPFVGERTLCTPSSVVFCTREEVPLIASVRKCVPIFPTNDKFKGLLQYLNCQTSLTGEMIVEELTAISKTFIPENEVSKVHNILSRIYGSELILNTSLFPKFVYVKQENIFTFPKNVVKRPPFELEPFFYSFYALNYSQNAWRLFEKHGACREPSPQQLFYILQQLYDTQSESDNSSNPTNLILNITNYLFDKLNRIQYRSLLLIGEDNYLHPALDCLYRDDNLSACVNIDIDGKLYNFVNSRVSIKVAEQFGARSLKYTLLSDDDDTIYGFCEAAGQYEDLTTRLKSILQQYASSIDVFKELVQNADDAKANSFRVLIDYSSFPSETLLEDSMRHWQGPALYFYNDAQFTDADYANILKIFGQTKRDNMFKIGKFGLGFNTVYHITDLPSFVSGTYLYMLDPHRKYIAKRSSKPGIRVDFVKKHYRILMYSDQFSVFNIEQFNCNVFEKMAYKGTLFRLPFRTNSVDSDISTETYGDLKIQELKTLILKEAESTVRFLQHVNSIEIFERDKQKHIALVLRVNKHVNSNPIPDNNSFLSYNSAHFDIIPSGATVDPITLCQSVTITKELEGSTTSEDFIVTYSSGTRQCQAFICNNDIPNFPFCSIALSTKTLERSTCDLKLRCQLYCFLPLPVTSPYPMFINGYFALDNSRRGLFCTEDGNINTEWNKVLINDALVNALIHLLLEIRGSTDVIQYYSLWPTDSDATLWCEYSKCTGTRIIESNVPLILCDAYDSTEWLGYRECSFFDCANFNCGLDDFFVFVRKFSAKLELARFAIIPISFYSQQVFSTIIYFDRNKLYNLSRICNQIIFQNLEAIDFENLYLVLSSLIPLAKEKPNKWIIDLFRSKPSIPCGSQFKWQYRFPQQTINPNSKLANLYDSSDERLPHPMFTNLFCKKNSSVFEGLLVLNMIDKKLPVEDLIDRTTCQTGFSMERRKLHCAAIIEYFDKSDNKYTHSETQKFLNALNNTSFVPVCKNDVFVKLGLQPDYQFASPNACSAYSLRFVITPKLYSVSEEFTKYQKFFKLFSICMDKSEIQGEMLTKILEIFHQHQNQILNQGLSDSITSTVLSIYEALIEVSIKRTPTQSASTVLTDKGKEIQKFLHNKHWIWHPPSNTFYKVSHIIGSGYQQYNSKFLLCFPYNQLLEKPSHKEFFSCLGLQFDMTRNYVIDVINRMKNYYQTESLPEGEVELVLDLIQKYFHYTDTSYPDLQYILSANGVLCSTSELVRDDMPWKKRLDSGNSKFAHPRLSLLCLYNLNVPSSRNALYKSVAFNQMDFGQFEDISTRIENLKREFPNDSTILKEFLQNAEDAQATEFSVILDYKKDYKSESLCYGKMDQPNWYKYQESASLLIYNNKPFTTEDLAGIQSVGLGGKQNKQTIGKFGLGFNTVYHLTKSPCLLTKRKVNDTFVITYCVFDPYREYLNLSGNQSPGVRLEFTLANFMDFSDQFEPFLLPTSCLDLSSEYSLFRIPFFSKTTSESVEKNHIAEFLKQASGITLFLKNICNIKVFKFDLFGKSSTMGSLNSQFLRRMQHPPPLPISANILLSKGTSDITFKRISTIIASSSSHITSTWLIYNFHGNLSAFETVCTEITAHKKKYENEKLTNSIYGGIAFEIPSDSYSYESCIKKSYLYSYLPIGTAISHHNFPMNINAPFIVDSHRHYLRFQDTTESADKKWHDTWHIGILKHIIVPMYFSLLVNLKNPQNLGLTEYFSAWELKDYYNWYYSLFPDSVLLERGQTQNSLFLSQLCRELYSLLHTSNQCVLISEDFSKWLSFTGNTQGAFRNTYLPNNPLHNLSSSPAVNDEINSILAKIKYPITGASNHIAVNLGKFRFSFQSINQLHVLHFLNEKTCHLSKNSFFPTELSNSILTLEEIISLLKYLFRVSQDISSQYQGIPLKVDSSDTIRKFSKSDPTFDSEYSTLLTGCESNFLTHRFPTDIVGNLINLGYLKPLTYTFLSNHMVPLHFDLDKMILFWKFILNCFPRESPLEKIFGDMNVVPVLRKVSSKRDYLKISQLPCILQRTISSFYLQNDIIFNILSKLDCPILDLEIFLPTQHFTLSAIKSCLDKYTFDYSPQNVINALSLVIPCSLSNKLDHQESNCLRNLFLTKQMNYDTNYLRIISSLKMFVTNSDTLVSLNECRICFVSIEKIPIVNELLQYFSEINVTIIIANTDDHKTNTITICGGCAITVIDSYKTLFRDYMLPKFVELTIPQQQLLLVFIQTINSKDSISYLSIIEALKHIPFIQLLGKSKKFLVSELYDSNIELFRSFYSEFLIPETWLLNNRTVIHKLGLHSQLDLKSIKECAIEVSTKKYGVISNTKIMLPLLSLIKLIKYLNSLNTNYNFINFVEFANIAFLPLWKYQLNFQKEYKLGRFCDANLETQCHCCSTSSWIHCPEIQVVDFNPYLINCLGILISPPTSEVLPHLINISNNFNSMHQLDKQVYFECTYTYLQNCNAIDLSRISGLACIFYDKILYQTKNMVFEIKDEFKPFLFKVPPQLEKYKKFLTNLGVQESPTYCHYAAVMKDIALSTTPSTVETYGEKVFLLFISALRERESANQTISLNLSDTYVLTKNFTCILQSKAIFIDNTKLLILVDSFSSLANFDFLFELPANKHGSCEPPKCLEIKYLRSIIQESLTVRTRATPSIQTDTTNEIQRLLKTLNFYHGLVRIYYSSTKGKGKDNLTKVRIKNGVLYDISESPLIVDDKSYTSIKDILNELVVIGVNKIEVEVTNLQTGEKLCRGDIHQCFMEDSRLYIQANCQVKDLYCDLTYLLNVYLCNIFSQSLFHLQACLTSHPDKIPFTLNSYNIPQCPYLNIMTPPNTPKRAPTAPTPPPLMTRDKLFQIFHRSRNTNSTPSRTTPFTAPISPSISTIIPSSPVHSRVPSIPTSPSMPRTSLNSSPSLPRTPVPPSPVLRTSTLPTSSHSPSLLHSSRVPLSLPLPSTRVTTSCDEYTAKLWIRTAQCDLRAAQKLLHRCEEDRSVYTAHACFYCFECAIKSCISVICLKRCYQVNISYERNLDVIIDILKLFLPQDEHTQLVNLCLSLMNYNEAARDPCLTPAIGCCIPIECYSIDAAKEAIESATNIFQLIKNKFPEIEGLMFNDEDNVWEHPPITSLLKTHLDNIQMRSDGYYEILPEDCQEYYTVARNFFDCLPQAQIIKISKIHNQVCWGNFKRKVEAKFQTVESESYSLSEGSLLIKPLFHGSSRTDPIKIIENSIGFKVEYSRVGLWGRGLYFASNAAYSHVYSYSVSKERHEHSMFLAKVFVGNSKKLTWDRTIQSPPPGYHTVNGVIPVSDRTPGTKAYILYEDGLAYPSYLINYRYFDKFR